MKIDHPRQRDIPSLRRLWKQAFGDSDEYLDLFFSAGYDPQRCLCAVDGDTAAAALYWLDGSCRGRTVAYLYAVATDEAFRGRGLCRDLTERAHGILKARGYAGAVLVPAEPGLFIMYGKMGYRTCATVTEWEAHGGDIPLPLTELTVQEYAARRREMLPEGAVVQEGPTLEVLGAMGRFYAGNGVLLTAMLEKDKLWVPELLGDPEKAPGIVTALGATQGKFRSPGPDQNFAMYCPFDDSPAPTYLGIALD